MWFQRNYTNEADYLAQENIIKDRLIEKDYPSRKLDRIIEEVLQTKDRSIRI